MSEYWTCNECQILYDERDGDTDERMCFVCLNRIYAEGLERKSKKQVKSAMRKVDKFINWVKKHEYM